MRAKIGKRCMRASHVEQQVNAQPSNVGSAPAPFSWNGEPESRAYYANALDRRKGSALGILTP
jgi:hypothetical protein